MGSVVWREAGFPELQRQTYRPTINRAENYATAAGTLVGAIIGYLAGNNPESTVGGAVIGGLGARSVEWLFEPLARIMGVPNRAEIPGTLGNMSKLKDNYKLKLAK